MLPPEVEMKEGFVCDGARRVDPSADYQAKLKKLKQSLEARYSSELSRPGVFRRALIRWRIARELKRERRRMGPSSQALYGQTPSPSFEK
jgi:hypothetical protein